MGADLGTRSIRVTACGPLCARFESAAAPRAPDAEIAWYRERLPRGAGSVLEAMCGHGRVLVPLFEAGAQIVTFGDMPNDVLMFSKSGFSIAMGNSSDEVKAQASAVTDSNEQEGFANAVRKFVLCRAAA